MLAEASVVDPEVVALLDEEARAAASASLDAARAAFAETGSWGEAGPLQLTLREPSLMYVDGPSTTPAIVSVHTTDAAWSAAVMGPSGACYWVTTTKDGRTRYGQGTGCTGRDALAASGLAW